MEPDYTELLNQIIANTDQMITSFDQVIAYQEKIYQLILLLIGLFVLKMIVGGLFE